MKRPIGSLRQESVLPPGLERDLPMDFPNTFRGFSTRALSHQPNPSTSLRSLCRVRRFRPRQESRRSNRHSVAPGGRFCTDGMRSDWTTSATRFTESKLVGCAREWPGQNARVCGRSADRGPLARATLRRPADRGCFSPGRGEETCRSRIFFPGPWERDLPIEDLSLGPE